MTERNTKKSLLHDWHVTHHAKMGLFGGYEMPIWYPTGAKKEHLAVLQHAGLFDTFEEYKRHYWKKPIKDYNEVPRYAAFLPWLRGHDILDVGCDGGALTDYLHRQGLHVVGLDITEDYITRNRERMPEIEWVLAAFEETEYREEFDTLICAEVLEHVFEV